MTGWLIGIGAALAVVGFGGYFYFFKMDNSDLGGGFDDYRI